jgi:large subunit ribosomal protein L9
VEVILKQDIPKLGKMGDVVRVRDGYARNYLLPRGMALVANQRNLRVLEHQRRILQEKRGRVLRQAQSLAEKLAQVALTVPARVGETGRLFGSVTNLDLEQALREQGVEIDRRDILLEGPIKAVGEYEVPVRIAPEVTAQIKVRVVPLEEAEAGA